MSTTQLRPLGIGEILDVGIKVFTTNARTLITIAAIVSVPFELLSGVIKLSTVSSADEVGGSFSVGTSMMNADFSRARIAGLVVTSLIGLVVNLVLAAATVKAVSDAYLGTAPSARDSILFALRRIRSVLWLYLLLGLGLTLAFVALVIPSVWLGVAWSMATPVLLLENVRGTAALRRSFRLVRGRWWPTLGVQLAAGLIVSIAAGLVAGLLVAIPILVDDSSVLLAVIGSTIAGTIATALVHPFDGAITTILYFDLRVRKEGFDLSLLAAGLGLPEAQPPAYLRRPAGPVPASPGEPSEAPPFWPPPPGWKPGGPGAPAGGNEPQGPGAPVAQWWPPAGAKPGGENPARDEE